LSSICTPINRKRLLAISNSTMVFFCMTDSQKVSSPIAFVSLMELGSSIAFVGVKYVTTAMITLLSLAHHAEKCHHGAR
jgi:hypothetical protein